MGHLSPCYRRVCTIQAGSRRIQQLPFVFSLVPAGFLPSLSPADYSIPYIGATCKGFSAHCSILLIKRSFSTRGVSLHIYVPNVINAATIEQASIHSVLPYNMAYIGQKNTNSPIFVIIAHKPYILLYLSILPK